MFQLYKCRKYNKTEEIYITDQWTDTPNLDALTPLLLNSRFEVWTRVVYSDAISWNRSSFMWNERNLKMKVNRIGMWVAKTEHDYAWHDLVCSLSKHEMKSEEVCLKLVVTSFGECRAPPPMARVRPGFWLVGQPLLCDTKYHVIWIYLYKLYNNFYTMLSHYKIKIIGRN